MIPVELHKLKIQITSNPFCLPCKGIHQWAYNFLSLQCQCQEYTLKESLEIGSNSYKGDFHGEKESD